MRKVLFLLPVLVFLFLYGCSSDDENTKLSLNKSAVTLNYKTTEQLEASGKVEWTSENDFVASVNENGVIEGKHVGKTFIVASNGTEEVKCAVEVTPKYNIYREPILDFGITKEELKGRENRELLSETSTAIKYRGNSGSAASEIAYAFKNDKMNGAGALLKSSYSSVIMDFLVERYQAAFQEDGVFYFIDGTTSNYTKFVSLSIGSSGIIIMYTPKN